MPVAKPTEDTITALLARELERRGVKVQQFTSVTLPKVGLRKPDLWCENGGIYPIEAKFYEGELIDAISKVYNDYLSDPGVAGGFAILYPEQLSRPGLSKEVVEKLATKLKFRLVPVFRPEDARKGFVMFEKTLPEVAEILAEYILAPPERVEPSVPDIIKTLRSAAIHLVSALTNLTEDQLGDLFGGEEVFENILQYQERKYPIDSLRSAAAYILVTQLLFYHVLSKINAKLFPEIDSTQVKQPADLKHLYFDKVLNINYKAVLSYDVVTKVDRRHLHLIQSVISAIKAIAPEKVRGDLLGTIFHDLIPLETRKSVAAFYTNVLAAELLAWLAIDRHDARVADFAVGSGGLLVAAYRRKRHLVEQERSFTENDHRRFVENELLGIDVMPFAAKDAACHLALQEPMYFTNKVLIAIWDSTELKPKKEIPPIATLEQILTGQTRLESFGEKGLGARRKGVVGLRDGMDEGGEKIKLEKYDVVIMNPPFTRQ